MHAGDTKADQNKSPDFSTLLEFLIGTTHAGDVMAVDLKTLDFSLLSEFLVGTGVISGAITGRSEAFLHGIQIGLIVGVLNTTVTILSPLVEWWADNLPDRALGGYGAFMVLIGSALQTVQYVTPLISR